MRMVSVGVLVPWRLFQLPPIGIAKHLAGRDPAGAGAIRAAGGEAAAGEGGGGHASFFIYLEPPQGVVCGEIGNRRDKPAGKFPVPRSLGGWSRFLGWAQACA